mmetsp:Transcript_99522/g.201852  ORF Transcript_99522/g.201852 Transcript_99522/m.201852 type:complete len:100 (+) Transcript_99522:101-400(+)
MGQACLGVIKGLTLGGLLVWFIIDYAAILITCLSKAETINAVGYRASFTGVEAAFWIASTILVLKLFSFVRATCLSKRSSPEPPLGSSEPAQAMAEASA